MLLSIMLRGHAIYNIDSLKYFALDITSMKRILVYAFIQQLNQKEGSNNNESIFYLLLINCCTRRILNQTAPMQVL